LKGTGTGTAGQIEGSATSDYTFLQVFNPSGVQGQITANGNTDLQLRGVSNHPLSFYTNNTERLRITAAGNVGIGTTSPSSNLTVGGNPPAGGAIAAVGSAAGIALALSDNTNSSLYVRTASGGAIIGTDAGGTIRFATSGNNTANEKARIDNSGRLLVGTSTSYTLGGGDRRLQVHGANASEAAIGVTRWSADSGAPRLLFGKARGSLGAFTAVIDGDNLGAIDFLGANGTDLSNVGAAIAAFVDGDPFTSGDTTDLPGRLVFSVTADGASSPTEALRISNNRAITVSDGGNVVLGTTTGTKIGTATTQKLGFYNATPVVQPAAVADATTAIDVITQLNDLLAKLRTLGIIAT
jgi:hypothetical protein